MEDETENEEQKIVIKSHAFLIDLAKIVIISHAFLLDLPNIYIMGFV
jgi:hypothetical protein